MQLVVDGREYHVPEDFTLGTWEELQKWNTNNDKCLSIAFGLPIETIQRMSEKTKHLGLAFISTAMYPDYKPLNKKINSGTLINFSEMTLGQFIDLEVFVGRDFTKHIKDISSILYQTKVDNFWFIGDIWGGIKSYLKWRITLYNSYKNLFNIDNDVRDEVEDTTDSKVDVAHVWYDTIMILADGKFLNIEAVTDRPLVEALNYLAWNKTKIERETELLRQTKSQIK
jgi:hypothetical protein